MRRVFGILFIAVSIAAMLPSPANAAAVIRIKVIRFDPSGPDAGSLNREFIVIENVGDRPKSLKGWTLFDEGQENYYRFIDLRLKPGQRIRLHTGSGSDHGDDRYWDQSVPVWDNNGDKAVLRRFDGSTGDTCKYDGSADSRIEC